MKLRLLFFVLRSFFFRAFRLLVSPQSCDTDLIRQPTPHRAKREIAKEDGIQVATTPGIYLSFEQQHRNRARLPLLLLLLLLLREGLRRMDITNFVVSYREEALLIGDYNTYRGQLSRRLHTVRKRLGQTTPKGRKFTSKAPVTAEDVCRNTEYIYRPGSFIKSIAYDDVDMADCSYFALSAPGQTQCI